MKKLKSASVTLLFLVISALMGGCAVNSTYSVNGKDENGMSIGTKSSPIQKNEIAPKELTPEQEEIVNLLSSGKQEILLFDYRTDETYKNAEFWVEVYESGELTKRILGVNSLSDEARTLDGQLAILITQNSGFQWTFTESKGGGKISNTSEVVNMDHEATGRTYGPIDGPVAIEDGKEIVLYTSIFSNGGGSSYSDQQIYIEQPELLKEYPYVHIIKCKFTAES